MEHELSKEQLICMLEDYKDKYELAIEERDEEILRTLNQHDDMLDLQDKIDQREMFTKAAMKQLKEITKERDNLKHQLGKLTTEKKKSSVEAVVAVVTENVRVKRVEAVGNVGTENVRVKRVEAVGNVGTENVRVKRVEAVEDAASENVRVKQVEDVVSEEYNEEAEALLQRSEKLLESQDQLQQIRQQLDMIEEINSAEISLNESVEVESQQQLQQIKQQLDMLEEMNSKYQVIPPIKSLPNESVEDQAPLSAIFSSSFDNTPLPTLRKRSTQVSPPPARYGRPKSFVVPIKKINQAPGGFVSFDDTPLPALCKPPVSPPLPALQRRKSLLKPNKDVGQAESVQSCMNRFKVLPPVTEQPKSSTASTFFVSFGDTPLPIPPVSPPPAKLSRPKSFFVPVKDDGPVETVQNCVNSFKALTPVSVKPPLPPVARRRPSVQVTKPAVSRGSSVQAKSPAVRRHSSVRAMSPAVRRRTSVQTVAGSLLARSAESNVLFVLPGIGEQSHF